MDGGAIVNFIASRFVRNVCLINKRCQQTEDDHETGSTMKIILVIGAGSFIGGVLRYLLSQFVQTKFLSTFPFGTLTVNIVGCFFIGMVFGLADRGNLSQEWRLFLATGLLGGFTTYSAFSSESVGLLRDGQFWYATAYILASVFIGLTATFVGSATTKFI